MTHADFEPRNKPRSTAGNSPSPPAASVTAPPQSATPTRSTTPAEAASPPPSQPNASPGGNRGSYDASKARDDGEVAALELAGKREAAELLKARQKRGGEFKRIDEASNSGGLSVADSVYASRAVATEYENAVEQVRDRFAQERERNAKQAVAEQKADAKTLAAEMAQIDEYKLQATIANLKAQGNVRDAELLAFDASWKKRIDNATSEEKRCTAVVAYEAERRMKVRELESRDAGGLTSGKGGMGASALPKSIVPAFRQRRRVK